MGWLQLGITDTGPRVVVEDVEERQADEMTVGPRQPFGLRHPVADARLGEQRPGPAVLLLLDIQKRILLRVKLVVEFAFEELFEVVFVTEDRDLGLNAEAVRKILDVLLPQETAACVGVVIFTAARKTEAVGAAQVVGMRVINAVGLDQPAHPGRHAEEVWFGVVKLRTQPRAPLAQVVQVQLPARPGIGIDAEQIIGIEGSIGLKSQNAVVIDAYA